MNLKCLLFKNQLFKWLHLIPFIGILITFISVTAVANELKEREHNQADSIGFSKNYMVSAANPYAVNAGLEILKVGGTAADAAVAIQLVLNLVEPQSSGIGGGAFLLYYDGLNRELVTYDGRETAPEDINQKLFLDKQGKPLKFINAVVGGRAVGTPGTLALLEMVHSNHGKMEWKKLFESSIRLSERGFTVSKRLHDYLRGNYGNRLRTFETARNFYFPDGKPIKNGDLLKNLSFAKTLRLLSKVGVKAFYNGALADGIEKTVKNSALNPGFLSKSDLIKYRAIKRYPTCYYYRKHKICGMGPPSSGAIAIGQILGMLEKFNLNELGPENTNSWHYISEASKLAFADRNKYVADPDFIQVPTQELLNSHYLNTRAKLISPKRSILTPAPAGNPIPKLSHRYSSDLGHSRSGTSHISVIDKYGNAISMTTTIEGPFGSQLMTDGFLLNNELTDFSFLPSRNGRLIANRVEPLKRPRSSMSPTMVFDNDENLKLVIGSPGGSRIIGYVVKTLIAVIDWNLDIQSAINLGNVVNRNGNTEIEYGTNAIKFKNSLESLGHKIKIRKLNSGVHAILVKNDYLVGGADPRREGVAQGN